MYLFKAKIQKVSVTKVFFGENNRDFNIDQNNRDYDFFHNRATLHCSDVELTPESRTCPGPLRPETSRSARLCAPSPSPRRWTALSWSLEVHHINVV